MLARREASASSQVEIEDASAVNQALRIELRQLKESAAEAAVEAQRQIAELKAQLASSDARAYKAEAKVVVMADGKQEASDRAKAFAKQLARAEKRMAELKAKASARSSSSTAVGLVYDDEDIEEFETTIGALTQQVGALQQGAKDSAVEYERNRSAVANFRMKHAELAVTKDRLRTETAAMEGLRAEIAGLKASPLPGLEVPLYDIKRDPSRQGAPYDGYFEAVIAPAMLNTGATPEQINAIIRKSFLDLTPQPLSLTFFLSLSPPPPPPTHV